MKRTEIVRIKISEKVRKFELWIFTKLMQCSLDSRPHFLGTIGKCSGWPARNGKDSAEGEVMVYVHALPSSLQIFVHLVLQEEVDMIFLRRVELMRGAQGGRQE